MIHLLKYFHTLVSYFAQNKSDYRPNRRSWLRFSVLWIYIYTYSSIFTRYALSPRHITLSYSAHLPHRLPCSSRHRYFVISRRQINELQASICSGMLGSIYFLCFCFCFYLKLSAVPLMQPIFIFACSPLILLQIVSYSALYWLSFSLENFSARALILIVFWDFVSFGFDIFSDVHFGHFI